jgi:hypothetical protein
MAGRNGRSPEEYGRRMPNREPYDFVLIVCEGQKSEPNYFSKLREKYRLSSLNVRVSPADGSDPMSVVGYAERHLATGYDRIYCVFDRNGHANYDQALAKTERLEKIFAVPSIPCFEVWVLLHFKYSTAPFEKAGSDSARDKVFKEVKKHLKKYSKGYQELYNELEKLMSDAIAHSKRLEAHNSKTGSCNPATHVHVLVEYLKNLRPTG